MKLINRTYRFRLLPNKEQETLLNKHFGCARFIYNHFLDERKTQYQSDKKSDNYYAQAKTLTLLKKEEETIWLKEVNSQSLQFALRCLDTAYVRFFRGASKFPRFKSKKEKNSFTVPQFFSVEDGKLFLPKFKEGIPMNMHRTFSGEIGHCTITKAPSGKVFVSLHVEEQYEPKAKTGKTIGADLGVKTMIALSDGTQFKNPKHTKRYEKKLKAAQQHLSRKRKGSRSYDNQRRKVALLHEKISNARKDNLHKISHRLVSDYDVICLESLNVKGMMAKNKPKQDANGKFLPNGQAAKRGRNKTIQDVAWGEFVRQVQYKAEWNDKRVSKIDRFYPSSKTCNCCGWIKQNLDLSMRKWDCEGCGAHLDRDLNAAINIHKEGLKELSAGTVDHTGGETVSLGNELVSVKPEAHWSSANG